MWRGGRGGYNLNLSGQGRIGYGYNPKNVVYNLWLCDWNEFYVPSTWLSTKTVSKPAFDASVLADISTPTLQFVIIPTQYLIRWESVSGGTVLPTALNHFDIEFRFEEPKLGAGCQNTGDARIGGEPFSILSCKSCSIVFGWWSVYGYLVIGSNVQVRPELKIGAW
jgi:hypothetical protein